MSRHEEKLVKGAVNWISKIRPEYQVTELTAETQRVMLKHGNAIQILALMTAGACFGLLYMENKVDNLEHKMEINEAKMKQEIHDLKND